MKCLIVLLVGLCILLAACAAPAARPQPAPTAVAGELPETQGSPAAIAFATATLVQPASTLASASPSDTPTAQPSAQPTAAPLPTQTLLPQPEQWRWGYDNISSSIIAMSLAGEMRKLAPVDQEVAYNAWLISVDATRGLYFSAVNGHLRVYLLTSDAMTEITMPETYPQNPEIFPGDTRLIHMYGSQIAFAFVVTDAVGSYPSDGPLFVVDIDTLTAKLIDPKVYFSPNLDVRAWIFSTADERIIRYTSSSGKGLEIRELDMQSGQVSTILTSSGSPYGTAASPAGDLWYLSKTGTIQDLAQNQKGIASEVSFFRPIDGEQGIILPNQCTDKCALQVISPFGDSAVKYYTLPWSIQTLTYYRQYLRLLPDDDLIVVGQMAANFTKPPSLMQDYPTLKNIEQPAIRLSPDGKARLLGIYPAAEFSGVGSSPLSQDGRYLVLKAIDGASFFVYDMQNDSNLFNFPLDPALDYFYATANYFDQGILLHLTASLADKTYQDFYSLYRNNTADTVNWTDNSTQMFACSDMYADNTLACWFTLPDDSYAFSRFDPASGKKTPLAEHLMLLENLP